MSSTPRLLAHDLHYNYDHGVHALQGISLQLEPGASLALIGSNGSGKTTLAKCLAGILQPAAGTVLVEGADLISMTPSARAARIGFVFQSPDHQIFSSSTKAEIEFGLHNLGLPEDEVHRRTDHALSYFGLEPFRAQAPATLSFGLRRKITVAAVYAMRPSIILLDEPTLGLHWQAATELMEGMRDLQRSGTSLVFISHDLRLVAEYADACAVLRNGKLAAHGPTAQILMNAEALGTAGLSPPSIPALTAALAPLGLDPGAITVTAFVDSYVRLLAGGSE